MNTIKISIYKNLFIKNRILKNYPKELIAEYIDAIILYNDIYYNMFINFKCDRFDKINVLIYLYHIYIDDFENLIIILNGVNKKAVYDAQMPLITLCYKNDIFYTYLLTKYINLKKFNNNTIKHHQITLLLDIIDDLIKKDKIHIFKKCYMILKQYDVHDIIYYSMNIRYKNTRFIQNKIFQYMNLYMNSQ